MEYLPPSLSIQVQYFKGFAQAELTLASPMTVLIGRNGAGKSNLLEAVSLLAELTTGRPLHEIEEPGRGRGYEVRGGLIGCPSLGERWFVLGCRSSSFTYEVAVRPEVGLIESESLSFQDSLLFESVDQRTNIRRRVMDVRYRTSAEMAESAAVATLPADRTALSEYPSFLEQPTLPTSLHQDLVDFKGAMGRCWTLTPHPEAMRQFQRVGLGLGGRQLTRNGSNLSAVLHDLKHGNEQDRSALDLVFAQLRQLPEEDFVALDFIESSGGDVMLALRPSADRAAIDARLLSDGTLRFLATLTALEVLPTGALLLLEDIDAGLHPSRAAALMNHMWERCQVRGLTALVTTHSPTILNALTPAQLEGVVLCYRDGDRGSAALIPLLQISEADLLMERGPLGDLITRQIIEQHLHPDFMERRKEQLLSWLAELP